MNDTPPIAVKYAIAGVALAVALAGCSGYNNARGVGDAPLAGNADRSAAEVFQMPDGFANVATKCVGHGFRAYVTTRGDSRPAQLQIVADTTCGGNVR